MVVLPVADIRGSSVRMYINVFEFDSMNEGYSDGITEKGAHPQSFRSPPSRLPQSSQTGQPFSIVPKSTKQSRAI